MLIDEQAIGFGAEVYPVGRSTESVQVLRVISSVQNDLIDGRKSDEECCSNAAWLVVVEGDKIHSAFDFGVRNHWLPDVSSTPYSRAHAPWGWPLLLPCWAEHM